MSLIAPLVSGDFPRSRLLTASLVVILFSLSAASLGWLFSQWGGMVPPSFQYKEGHLTLSAMAFTLVLAGCYGPFFATCVLEGQGLSSKLRSLSGRELRLMAVGAVVATVVGALAPTSYEEPARASALWNLAKLVPAFGVHSPVMIVLCGVGGAMATLVALRLCESDRYIIAAAFAAFVAAHSTNLVLYQRYYEPFILIVLSLSANRIVAAGSRSAMSNRSAWWVAVGPLALGVGQLLITAWKVASPEVLLTVVRS